jgi:hypothetical protein
MIPEERLGTEESHLSRPKLEVAVLVVHHGHNHASCVDQHLTQREATIIKSRHYSLHLSETHTHVISQENTPVWSCMYPDNPPCRTEIRKNTNAPYEDTVPLDMHIISLTVVYLKAEYNQDAKWRQSARC